MKQKLSPYENLLLFFSFFKLGTTCFGGGWSIVAQMEEEFVNRRGWITREELLDFISLGRSLPGIMIINIAVMFGYHVGGILGGIAAAFGVALPSILVLLIVAVFYNKVRNNVYIAKAMVGVRAAVVPIILSAVQKMWSAALVDKIAWGVMLVSLALAAFTPINNIWIVIASAACGILLNWRRKNGALD